MAIYKVTIGGPEMFSKFKQVLGFVGIEVQLDIPSEIPKDDTIVEGKVRIIAKADQTITQVLIRMTEHWERGQQGKDYQTRDFDLGQVDIRETFDIKSGETREFPFKLSFQRRLSMTQKISEKKGVVGALGKVAAFADNERSSYRVHAMADVKGAALDPNASRNVNFI
jgi:sporulation-control protein spo0M